MSRMFGGLLLGIGILIMTCSGLCSLVVVLMGIPMVIESPALILFPIVVGGLPFGIGLGLFRWGQHLLRQADDPPTS